MTYYKESNKNVRQVVMSKKDIDKRLTKLFKTNFDKQKTKTDNNHQIK